MGHMNFGRFDSSIIQQPLIVYKLYDIQKKAGVASFLLNTLKVLFEYSFVCIMDESNRPRFIWAICVSLLLRC